MANSELQNIPAALYHNIFHDLSVGMFVVSPDMEVVKHNKAYQGLLEHLEKHPLVPDVDGDPSTAQNEQEYLEALALGQRSSYSIEKLTPAKDGTNIWVRLTCSQISDMPTGWLLCMLEDITSSKEAQLALEKQNTSLQSIVQERIDHLIHIQQRTAAILDSSPDSIILLRPTMEIATSNLAFNEQFQASLDAYFNKSFLDLIHPGDASEVQASLSHVMNDQTVRRLEARVVRSDRSIFDADIALSPVIEKAGIAGIVCSIRDITALKDVERMKDSLIDTVSHELNTPITNFRLYHHLLRARPEKAEQYLEVMEQEINRLESIVKEVIAMSKLTQENARNSNFESTCLSDRVEEVIEMLRPVAQTNSVRLDTNFDADFCEIEGSPELISKVARSFISNALAYTPEDGQVFVEVVNKIHKGQHGVMLKIQDTGLGLSEDDKQNLFSRFYRGQAASRTGASGAGLSLAITREIVHQSRGFIDVASDGIDKGSTFTVWFPIV